MTGLNDEQRAAEKERLRKKTYPPLTPEQRAVIAESFHGVDVFGPESDDAA